MHIQENDKKCSGCKACINICPVGAIGEKSDILGFSYPKVDLEKCINCGMCENVCQIDKVQLNARKEQRYFAAQCKDEKVLRKSSSGGVFHVLAEYIIGKNGVVYGACFDSEWNVVHERAINMEEIEKFYGSKYVQSDCSSIYKNIIEDLKNDKFVLFSGTPCQCEGILKFVRQKGISTHNFILVDFVCHGVASPLIWEQYMCQLAKDRGEIESYTFRNKDLGWEKFRTKIINKTGEDVSRNKYSFFEFYSSLMITRSSCFECAFTAFERCTDISLGDFWNIDSLENSFDINKGVSQVLINSRKGLDIFDCIREQINVIECTAEDCWQPHLEYPAEKPKGRTCFEQYYEDNSFENVLKKYGKGSFVGKCKRVMVPIVRKLGLYVIAGKLYNLFLGKGR